MVFKDIKIGDKFFDPYSGEEFIKVDNHSAKCVTGGDYFEGEIDNFSLDEEVYSDVDY